MSARILAVSLVEQGYSVDFIGSYSDPVHGTSGSSFICDYLTNLGISFNHTEGKIQYSYMGVSCTMVSKEKVANELRMVCAGHGSGKLVTLITGLERASKLIDVCRVFDIRCVAWIHDVLPQGLSVLRGQPEKVICTSEFVRQFVERTFHREAYLFYPPFDPIDEGDVPRGKSITMINPIPDKGVEVFLGLAELLSDRPFIAVDSWRPVDLGSQCPNISHLGKTDYIWDVYRKTRIVLLPSRFEEGFGRVAVEAGLLGIPCIASSRGGLAEAVGDGGILLGGYDLDSWLEAVLRMDDQGIYSSFSRASRKHARRFQRDFVQELVAKDILKS